jgi:hypothetical protein
MGRQDTYFQNLGDRILIFRIVETGYLFSESWRQDIYFRLQEDRILILYAARQDTYFWIPRKGNNVLLPRNCKKPLP